MDTASGGAIVISAVASSLLAPPDAVSMVLMMVPLWLLYEVGIWCAWVVERRRARRARAGAASAAGLAAQAAAVPGHAVCRRHPDRPRWRYGDHSPAGRSVRGARRDEGRIGLDPLPAGELSARCDR